MFQGKITKKGFKKRNPLGCLLAIIETGKTILSAADRFLALWLSRDADLDLSFLVDSNPDPCRHRTVDKQNEKKFTVKNIKKFLIEKFNILFILHLRHHEGLPGSENPESEF
jgi:hypothetical protein